jgi:hypothetical protein
MPLQHNSQPENDYQSARCSIKTTPDSGRVLCDSHIPGSYSKHQSTNMSLPLRKSGKENPTLRKRTGRQNLVVLESAERVLQGPFDAAVSHDRGPLSTQRGAR